MLNFGKALIENFEKIETADFPIQAYGKDQIRKYLNHVSLPTKDQN